MMWNIFSCVIGLFTLYLEKCLLLKIIHLNCWHLRILYIFLFGLDRKCPSRLLCWRFDSPWSFVKRWAGKPNFASQRYTAMHYLHRHGVTFSSRLLWRFYEHVHTRFYKDISFISYLGLDFRIIDNCRFNTVSNCQTLLQCGSVSLHSHQQHGESFVFANT